MADLSGECGDMILKALFVADKSVDIHPERKHCPRAYRGRQTGKCHQGDKSERFQGDGLTPGISAADDEKAIPFAKHEIQRNNTRRANGSHISASAATGIVRSLLYGFFFFQNQQGVQRIGQMQCSAFFHEDASAFKSGHQSAATKQYVHGNNQLPCGTRLRQFLHEKLGQLP